MTGLPTPEEDLLRHVIATLPAAVLADIGTRIPALCAADPEARALLFAITARYGATGCTMRVRPLLEAERRSREVGR